MKRFFWYKIQYYDFEQNKDIVISGLVCAANLTDATKILTSNEEGYGATVDQIELRDLVDPVLSESELKIIFPKQN